MINAKTQVERDLAKDTEVNRDGLFSPRNKINSQERSAADRQELKDLKAPVPELDGYITLIFQ